MKNSITLRMFVVAAFFAVLGGSVFAYAQTLDELKGQIEGKGQEIQKVKEKIQAYSEELLAKEQEAQTLENEIAKIDLTLRKFDSDIRLTTIRIDRTKLEIRELDEEISARTSSIISVRESLGVLLAAIARKDEEGLLTLFAKYKSLASFFDSVYYLLGLEKNVHERLRELRTLKAELEEAKTGAESKRREYAVLLNTLSAQKSAQDDQKKSRTLILAETKNQEKKYQELLREQEERRTALEQEIREIEQQIRITIDPSSLPDKGSGVLSWPLENISLKSCWNGGEDFKNCITQFFGWTSFAAAGGYSGNEHNGVDFRASVGTPVFAAESGMVEAMGDTDLGCRGASYGRWILIRHPNNLSTLYAHLSGQIVKAGDSVTRGQVIGYSGGLRGAPGSGYSKGPHLHLSVFAAQAVEITTIRSRVCGRNMTLPVAPINGYLNPLDYL